MASHTLVSVDSPELITRRAALPPAPVVCSHGPSRVRSARSGPPPHARTGGRCSSAHSGRHRRAPQRPTAAGSWSRSTPRRSELTAATVSLRTYGRRIDGKREHSREAALPSYGAKCRPPCPQRRQAARNRPCSDGSAAPGGRWNRQRRGLPGKKLPASCHKHT